MQTVYRLTDRELNARAVSPLLCGNFIELGYGLQTEPMWGELLFNGSFEKFAPYHGINKEWFDLLTGEKDGSTYEKDWRKFDWYHSGYEHNAWFAAPNDVETYLVEDDSTFVVETTPYADASIRLVEGGIHGSHCMRVCNTGSRQGGMAQRGKQLKKGAEYRFSGWFRSVSQEPVRITAALHRDGIFNEMQDSFSFELSAQDTEFRKYEYSFTAAQDGRAMLAVWVEGGEIECDCFSLMPAETCCGWRPEVIEALREVAPRVIRWPGGCFASFYDWRDAIGPMEQRKPTESYFWGGFQNNNVGCMELGNFCAALGAQQMICVNLFHPDKENYLKADNPRFAFPQFTDLHAGAALAADWVAYMNADESHPMGALRAVHGRKEPFGVQFWEIDNEACRWYSPEGYAEAVKVYSQAMKAVDPTIKIGMITYAFGDGKGLDDSDPFSGSLGRMLDIAGEYIDFFADRAVDPVEMSHKLRIMRAYNAAHGTQIRYCNTEWLSDNLFIFRHDSFDWGIADEDPFRYKSHRFSKWRQVMNVFRQLMLWQREGGDVLFVNFNNLANTHSQNVIDTPKEGVYVTAAGKAMGLMAASPAAWVLEIEDYTPQLMAPFQVQAAWDADRRSLVLYVFRLEEGRQQVTFDLQKLGRAFRRAKVNCVYAHDLLDMNTQADPERIKRLAYEAELDAGGKTVTVQVPGHSFAEIIVTP
ncbi:MAG: carbohydrate binding domain-containing protein [Oscillospiraceae bacterium]|nr:carbohydrate binding domain-containing protein [Oscillospiraceae bacterium]